MSEAVEKPREGETKEAEVMVAKIHRAAEELKAELSVDESSFRWIAPQTHRSARDYIVFEALDELQKMAMAALQSFEFCSGDEPDDDAAVTRLAAESVSDWMSLVQRKLIETLADLICLGQTSGDLYYRDFLLHAQLDHMLAGQLDLKKFYGSESSNLAHQIDEVTSEISALEAEGLEPSEAWYRKRQQSFDASKAKAGQLFASFGLRLNRALGLASDDEKAALGFSYGAGFGRASVGLHARPGPIDTAATLETARSSINQAIITGLSVLIRCQKVVDSTPEGENSWLRGVVDNNEGPTQLLETGLSGRAELGNIVMASGYLAQILEIAEGPLGYQSYRVRYLSKAPLPEIPEDWHRAQEVRLVLNPPRIREMLRQSEKHPDEAIAKLLSMDDTRLQDVFAESVAATDQATNGGLKEATLAQARAQAEERGATPS
jgi:hypothetical protein